MVVVLFFIVIGVFVFKFFFVIFGFEIIDELGGNIFFFVIFLVVMIDVQVI